MDYESSYNSAKSRYYNACSEINSCENRINELNQQKLQKVNQINQIKTDIRNNREALEAIGQIVKSDTSLNDRLSKITNTTEQAATNYSSMIKAGNVVSKNLSDVYNEEMINTRSTLTNIFESFKRKMNILSSRIGDLEGELRSAESALRDIESSITSTQSRLQDWRRTKSGASIDMEYYRRKMNEAV